MDSSLGGSIFILRLIFLLSQLIPFAEYRESCSPPHSLRQRVAEESSTTATLSHHHPLRDRIAIVTGASRGIGRAIALHLASLGAKLVINYTSSSTQGDLVASHINSDSPPDHPRAIAVKADISDPAQVKALFDAAESYFNFSPHIIVNSAGVLDTTYPSLPNTSLEEFDRIFAVNTRGAFLCCQEGATRLKKGGGGRIICLTTLLVAALRPGYGAYTASKAAVEAMVKILAKELKGTGITVNCVAPGPIATEMFFAGKTDEMVNRVVGECPLGRLDSRKMWRRWWGSWPVTVGSGSTVRSFVLMVAMFDWF